MTTSEPGRIHAVPETRRKRYAGEQRFAGTGVFECTDGYIYMMAGGIGANKFWSYSLQWLVDEKVPGVERLQGEQWDRIDYLLTDEAKRIFAEVFGPWANTKSKAELYHGSGCGDALVGRGRSDAREVLHELIGMTPAEAERLAEEGVLR